MRKIIPRRRVCINFPRDLLDIIVERTAVTNRSVSAETVYLVTQALDEAFRVDQELAAMMQQRGPAQLPH